ncbi:hypothetical protein CCP3SC15_3060003 [Gammaproteobacteria bacterium]
MIDFALVFSKMYDDPEFMKEMLELYLTRSPELIEAIKNNSAEAQTVRLSAHELKGMSLNISAEPVAQLAGEIEEAALANQLEKIPVLLDSLQKLFDLAQQEMRNYLKEHSLD